MPVKILVADDSATMRQIIHMTFAGEDAEIMAVDSAAAAVERARMNRPDVIFADASMGPTDGYELARTIKSDPSLANIAVIMLTSQFNTYDEARARASGVDDHVDKPFDTQVAIDKVSEVLSRPRASVATQTGARPAPPPAPPRAPAGSPAQSFSTTAGPKAGHRATVAFGSGGPQPPQQVAAAPAAPQRPLPPAMPAGRPQPAAAPLLEIVEEAAPAPLRPAQVTPVQKAPAAPARQPVSTNVMPGMQAAAPAAAARAATDGNSAMAERLGELGLSREQIEGVLALSRDVIERVVWEVVPDLAETLIREEIKRLTAE